MNRSSFLIGFLLGSLGMLLMITAMDNKIVPKETVVEVDRTIPTYFEKDVICYLNDQRRVDISIRGSVINTNSLYILPLVLCEFAEGEEQ